MANKKKKKNKKKKPHHIGKHEFIFNFVSLVIVICIGVYFGARSLYYYSKQNMNNKESAQTLNGFIMQNNAVVTDNSDGFHQDSDGYYFKGNVTNNYLTIGNIMYRVIRINNDNTVKIVPQNYVSSFMWGDSKDYQTSNIRTWLEKSDDPVSGVYYNTLPKVDKYFVKTTYHEDVLKDDKIKSSKKEYKDYVSLLGIKDYVQANGKSSYLNNGQLFYLLGHSEDGENLYVEDDGSIQTCDSLDGYGIRPVLTLKKNLAINGGDGTEKSPYSLKLDGEKLYVNQYVKIGEDIWVIYEDKNDILRLYPTTYIQDNGVEVIRNYSNTNSIFDVTDKANIAFFLNMVYYNTLSYRDFLVDNDYYIGEVSDDLGYNYQNIYNNKVTCKVGLFNIFDYNPSPVFSDYFYINTTSLVGSMQYNRYSNGLLEEADVRDEKHIVPVISILRSSIKSGTGALNDPYVVG